MVSRKLQFLVWATAFGGVFAQDFEPGEDGKFTISSDGLVAKVRATTKQP